MVASIELGRTDTGEVVGVDLPVLVASRLLVQANSGAGKSWLIRRLLEQTFGHIQHIVLDPEGEFSSLRERFDYVLAGKGGETVADPRSAKLLAHRLLELNASAIIDIYELKAHERVRFVRLFLEALVNAPRALWHPVLVVLDEAHVFAPQTGQAESADAVKDLATRGRKRGFCAVLATQRLSKLHKDAAAECNNKLIGRSALDVDMNRAGEELGFSSRDDRLSLRTLAPGEFYAFGPALTPIVTRLRVGSVQTTHPEAGARLAFTAPPPTDKVRALLPQLADLPAEAEEEVRTVDSLRRELAEMRKLLARAEKATEPTPCEHEPIIEELRRDLAYAVEYGNKQAAALNGIRQRLSGIDDDVQQALERPAPKQEVPHARGTARARTDAGTPASNPSTGRTGGGVGGSVAVARPRSVGSGESGIGLEGLKAGARRILEEIASRYPATWTRPQVGTLTGFAHTGGTFQNYLGELKRRGLVAEVAGRISATDAALDALGGKPPAPTSHDEAMAIWRKALKAGCFRMLEAVVDAGAFGLSRAELAEGVDMAVGGGTFMTYLGILRRNGLVTESGGAIVATDVLFP